MVILITNGRVGEEVVREPTCTVIVIVLVNREAVVSLLF